MKQLLILFFILTSAALSAEDKIQTLFDQKRFFELRTQLLQQDIKWQNSYDGKFYRAFIYNAFGKLKSSDSLIQNIFATNREELPDSMKYLLYELLIDNYIKESKYKDALTYYKKLAAVSDDPITASKKEAYLNMAQLYQALANTPPLNVNKENKIHYIPFHRNGMGHFVVPVSRNQVTQNFVFDSGANISVVTRTMAKQMNIKIFDKYSLSIGTSTEQNIQAGVGYAEEILIGNLIVNHAIFLVVADEQLTFNEVNYKINGIIGYPVMREMGEMIIGREGSLSIMPQSSYQDVNNLFMDGLSPILQTKFQGEDIQMLFDTGSTGSQLFRRFYLRYMLQTQSNGNKTQINIGGAGGIVLVNCYSWKKFPVTIAGKEIRIPLVHVITDEMGNNNKVADGVIGQNVVNLFDEMVLNLKDMYLIFRNRP
ncbi:MAG: aspartyl protease family protein [Bacteroidales bacterium]